MIDAISRSDGAFLRNLLWDWCSKNLINGYQHGLTVRHKSEPKAIRFYIRYVLRKYVGNDRARVAPVEFEVTIDYGEPPEVMYERAQAMWLLLEG